MNNLLIEKISNAFYEEVTDSRKDFIRSSLQDSSWLLNNLLWLNLDEDIDFQLQIVEYYLEDRRSYAQELLRFFDKFTGLQSDWALQRRILRKAYLSRGYLSQNSFEKILSGMKNFPVMNSDLDFAREILGYLADEDINAFLQKWHELQWLDPRVLSSVESRLIRYLEGFDMAFLFKNIHLFSTRKDDSEYQRSLLMRYRHNHGRDRVIEMMQYCTALLNDRDNLQEFFLLLYEDRSDHALENFSKFTALYNADSDYQFKLIDLMYHEESWGISSIAANFDKFKALQNVDDQRRVSKYLLRTNRGMRGVSQHFSKFNLLQDDKSIQTLIIEKMLEIQSFYLIKYFGNFPSYRGNQAAQDEIFLKGMENGAQPSDVLNYISNFDALSEREAWEKKLTISSLAYQGDPEHKFNDAQNSQHEVLLVNGMKEAWSEGNWDVAMSLIKHPRVRDILAKTWKKLILDYIDLRESLNFDISERSSWKGIGSRTSSEEAEELESEKINLRILKETISVNRITPTRTIQRLFLRYRNDSKSFDFVVKMLHNGQTIAENVFEVIYYKDEFRYQISEEAQSVIQRMSNSKFKGFSEETYSHIKSLKTDKERDEQLDEWAKKSREILSCRVISDEIRNSKFYHELVYAAYRPIGFSLSSVKKLLGDKFSNSDERVWMSQVDSWKTKTWKAMKNMGYRLRNGKSLDGTLPEKVLGWILSLKGMRSESLEFDFERFWKIMAGTAKGRSFSPKEGDIEYLVEYFLRKEGENSIKDSVTKLFKKYPIFNNTQNIQFTYDFISLLEDALQNLLPELIALEIERLTLDSSSDQFENQWIQKIVAKLEKGFVQQIKRLKDRNSEKSMSWIHANVLADMIQRSSGLKKEIKFYSKQKKVIEPINGGYPYSLRVVMTKSLESILSRSSAGLCTSDDWDKFAKSDFHQMVVIDDKMGLIVGNIQLHFFDGNKKVLGRFNPTSKFLQTTVDQKRLAAELVRIFHDFCDLNGLEGYIPEQTDWHQLTNRGNTVFSEEMEKYFGDKSYFEIYLNSHGHHTTNIYKCKRSLDQ